MLYSRVLGGAGKAKPVINPKPSAAPCRPRIPTAPGHRTDEQRFCALGMEFIYRVWGLTLGYGFCALGIGFIGFEA